MRNSIYDHVKLVLEEVPHTRNSDKALLFHVWYRQGLVVINGTESMLLWSRFKNANAAKAESVTRARRKVVELNPQLQATDPVVRARREKERTKGTFVFHERFRKVV